MYRSPFPQIENPQLTYLLLRLPPPLPLRLQRNRPCPDGGEAKDEHAGHDHHGVERGLGG